jgi:hypothetical protein
MNISSQPYLPAIRQPVGTQKVQPLVYFGQGNHETRLTLTNRTKADTAQIVKTMLAIDKCLSLYDFDPSDETLCQALTQLVKKAKKPSHNIANPEARLFLQEYGFLTPNGEITPDVANIIMAYTGGDPRWYQDLSIRYNDPVDVDNERYDTLQERFIKDDDTTEYFVRKIVEITGYAGLKLMQGYGWSSAKYLKSAYRALTDPHDPPEMRIWDLIQRICSPNQAMFEAVKRRVTYDFPSRRPNVMR